MKMLFVWVREFVSMIAHLGAAEAWNGPGILQKEGEPFTDARARLIRTRSAASLSRRSGISAASRLASRGLPLIFLALPLFAQPGPVSIRPDCFQFFTFTATGNSNVFDNRQAGCPYWTIVYTSNGFSAVSLVLQVAPDAGGTPGTWATYTATTGSNPLTATTQGNSLFNGPYFPWLRAQLTTATGTGSVSGIFYGWRTPAIIINGGATGSACPSPCPVEGLGTAGAQSGGVLTVQGDPSGTPVPVSGTLTPSGTQNVSILGNAAVLANQQAVTASAVALATNASKNICVKALAGNTANVYIGPTGITTATGMELAPGDSYCGPVANTNLLYVIAAATGSSVSWIATN